MLCLIGPCVAGRRVLRRFRNQRWGGCFPDEKKAPPPPPRFDEFCSCVEGWAFHLVLEHAWRDGWGVRKNEWVQ